MFGTSIMFSFVADDVQFSDHWHASDVIGTELVLLKRLVE